MSSPKPLSEVIKEWRERANTFRSARMYDGGYGNAKAFENCADELGQWSKAWGEQLEVSGNSTSELQAYTLRKAYDWVRKAILGLPAEKP
jgi:hypothetical protein